MYFPNVNLRVALSGTVGADSRLANNELSTRLYIGCSRAGKLRTLSAHLAAAISASDISSAIFAASRDSSDVFNSMALAAFAWLSRAPANWFRDVLSA